MAADSIIYSQEDLQADFEPKTQLNQIIKRLEGEKWKTGQVITEIRVNGMFITEQDEKRLSNSTLEEIQQLEIKVADPAVLVKESTVSAIGWIPKINEFSLRAAELIRAGDVFESHRVLKDIFSASQWLSEILNLIKKPLVISNKRKDFPQTWERVEEQYSKVIREMLQASEAKDYILLADLLEYEISCVMDNWLELLQSVNNIDQ